MGAKIVLSVQIANPKPPKVEKECAQPSLLEKVEEYVIRVKSPETESRKEWYYLQRLYERLQEVSKLTKEQEQILYWIEPLMQLYGHGDPHNAVDYDGSKMGRGKNHLKREI
jgi:hypothetical protein